MPSQINKKQAEMLFIRFDLFEPDRGATSHAMHKHYPFIARRVSKCFMK